MIMFYCNCCFNGVVAESIHRFHQIFRRFFLNNCNNGHKLSLFCKTKTGKLSGLHKGCVCFQHMLVLIAEFKVNTLVRLLIIILWVIKVKIVSYCSLNFNFKKWLIQFNVSCKDTPCTSTWLLKGTWNYW